MIRILLALLLVPTLAMAWDAEHMTCTAVRLSLSGPEHEAGGVMAQLDMQGRWVVVSWANVEWTAENNSDPLAKCVARELLAHRDAIAQNVTPDVRCPPEYLSDGGVMQRIIDADPILRSCS